MQREEDRALGAVIGAKDFNLLHCDTGLAMLSSCQEAVAGTGLAGHEGVIFTGLIVQAVVHGEKLVLLSGSPLQLPKDLAVSLAAHDDLTVDVLNVHVFSWIACIRPHQARLVGDAGLDVVDGGRRGRLLQ